MTATTQKPGKGGMSEQRRQRLRLEVSREAARLFWEQGVAATSGEQIAQGVGLSVRTIWRHFRSKESCAEPIITQGVEWFMDVMRGWPREQSLEDHLTAELAKQQREMPAARKADEMLGVKMIALADTEPALRSAWLMAYDLVERELVEIIAERMGRPADDLDARRHAAAAAAVVRVTEEHIGAALISGTDVARFRDLPSLASRVAGTIRTATGGAVGDPIA